MNSCRYYTPSQAEILTTEQLEDIVAWAETQDPAESLKVILVHCVLYATVLLQVAEAISIIFNGIFNLTRRVDIINILDEHVEVRQDQSVKVQTG